MVDPRELPLVAILRGLSRLLLYGPVMLLLSLRRIALSGQIIIIWLISLFFSPFKRLPFPICARKLGFLEAQCFPPCISRDKGGPG